MLPLLAERLELKKTPNPVPGLSPEMLMLPGPAMDTAPALMELLLFTATSPVAWLMDVMLNVAEFVRLILPLPVFVALKTLTALLLPARLVPALDVVVSVFAAVTLFADSVIDFPGESACNVTLT